MSSVTGASATDSPGATTSAWTAVATVSCVVVAAGQHQPAAVGQPAGEEDPGHLRPVLPDPDDALDTNP